MEPQSFFQIVDQPDLFRFRGFNLFQIFYNVFLSKQLESFDAVRKKPPQGLAWKLRTTWAWTWSMVKIAYYSILSRVKPPVLFFGAQGRHIDIEGKTFDLYNAQIVAHMNRQHFIILDNLPDNTSKIYQPNLYMQNFNVPAKLLRGLLRIVWGGALRRYAQVIVSRYPNLAINEKEAVNIVLRFYSQYLVYRFLLACLTPNRVLLICHYGREHVIAACKRRGVPVIELMHSSITNAHPHYNFPLSYKYLFHQALFPDKLAVYGEYWRQVVIQGNMFPEEAVIVAGYYLKVPDLPQYISYPPPTVILISGQYTVQCELYQYIAFLKTRLSSAEWRIVIKPHPAEEDEAYRDLLAHPWVTLSHESIYHLLARCDIHIGVYSGVMYEAIRYGVCNYTLFVKHVAEHCAAVVKSGVAQELKPDQLPTLYNHPALDTNYYFADYNSSVLFD